MDETVKHCRPESAEALAARGRVPLLVLPEGRELGKNRSTRVVRPGYYFPE